MKNQRFNSILWLCAFLQILWFTPLQAQTDESVSTEGEVEKEKPRRVSGIFGGFSAGYQFYSMEEFNNYFAPEAFAPVPDNSITLGGHGTMIVRNWVLGGEGHNATRKRASSSSLDAELNSNWGMANLGYVVLARKGFLLYPKLGFGAYTHELILKDQISTTSMDSISGGNFAGTTMTRRGLLGSAELTFEFTPSPKETSSGGFLFGLTAGYQMPLSDKGWEAYGISVTDGPEIDLGGMYVRLRVGLGGWIRQR
jgi:hypothetical protein